VTGRSVAGASVHSLFTERVPSASNLVQRELTSVGVGAERSRLRVSGGSYAPRKPSHRVQHRFDRGPGPRYPAGRGNGLGHEARPTACPRRCPRRCLAAQAVQSRRNSGHARRRRSRRPPPGERASGRRRPGHWPPPHAPAIPVDVAGMLVALEALEGSEQLSPIRCPHRGVLGLALRLTRAPSRATETPAQSRTFTCPGVVIATIGDAGATLSSGRRSAKAICVARRRRSPVPALYPGEPRTCWPAPPVSNRRWVLRGASRSANPKIPTPSARRP
jgi:hypothetical protein